MVPLELTTGPRERHPAMVWSFAVAMSLLAIATALALRPRLDTYTLLPDIGAVVLVAWFAGARPALLTTALVLLGTSFFLVPPHEALALPPPEDLIRLFGLALVSLTVAWASHSLRRARDQAEARTREVQALLVEMRAQASELEEQAVVLEEQAVELEQQVDTTRRALETVEQSEQALQQANLELAVTTYAIAHDLRSPLRAVDGFSALLARDYGERLDERARAHLQRIRHNVQRMGLLMDGLLSLARLSRAEVVREEVDLSAVAHEVLRVLGEAEPGRRMQWTVRDGMTVQGDPRLVALLLHNLIGNAWKFTRGREPGSITVDAEPADGAHGDGVVYAVRDNGAGFDMAHAEQLFRPFHRLHADDAFEGTGIGLATAKRIVERHGGRIWMESTPNEGAVIRFTLSAREAAHGRSNDGDGVVDGGADGEVHTAGGGQSR